MGVVYGSVLYDLLLWVPALHAVQNYLLLNGFCVHYLNIHIKSSAYDYELYFFLWC